MGPTPTAAAPHRFFPAGMRRRVIIFCFNPLQKDRPKLSAKAQQCADSCRARWISSYTRRGFGSTARKTAKPSFESGGNPLCQTPLGTGVAVKIIGVTLEALLRLQLSLNNRPEGTRDSVSIVGDSEVGSKRRSRTCREDKQRSTVLFPARHRRCGFATQ